MDTHLYFTRFCGSHFARICIPVTVPLYRIARLILVAVYGLPHTFCTVTVYYVWFTVCLRCRCYRLVACVCLVHRTVARVCAVCSFTHTCCGCRYAFGCGCVRSDILSGRGSPACRAYALHTVMRLPATPRFTCRSLVCWFVTFTGSYGCLRFTLRPLRSFTYAFQLLHGWFPYLLPLHTFTRTLLRTRATVPRLCHTTVAAPYVTYLRGCCYHGYGCTTFGCTHPVWLPTTHFTCLVCRSFTVAVFTPVWFTAFTAHLCVYRARVHGGGYLPRLDFARLLYTVAAVHVACAFTWLRAAPPAVCRAGLRAIRITVVGFCPVAGYTPPLPRTPTPALRGCGYAVVYHALVYGYTRLPSYLHVHRLAHLWLGLRCLRLLPLRLCRFGLPFRLRVAAQFTLPCPAFAAVGYCTVTLHRTGSPRYHTQVYAHARSLRSVTFCTWFTRFYRSVLQVGWLPFYVGFHTLYVVLCHHRTARLRRSARLRCGYRGSAVYGCVYLYAFVTPAALVGWFPVLDTHIAFAHCLRYVPFRYRSVVAWFVPRLPLPRCRVRLRITPVGYVVTFGWFTARVLQVPHAVHDIYTL